MFVQAVSIYPQVGKAPEVRAILEQRIPIDKSHGLRIGLFQNLFGPQTFTVRILHDGLEAYEKARDSNASDQEFQAFQANIALLLRQPSEIHLFDQIIRASEPGQGGRFYHRVSFKPQAGKSPDVQEILEEFTRARQAEGRSQARMVIERYPIDGAAVIAGDIYETLAEAENVIRSRSPLIRTLTEKTGPLLTEPLRHELQEVLIQVTS